MAISYSQSASAAATSATLVSTAAGDLILVCAYRSNSQTPPTVPGTYTSIVSRADGLTASLVVGYRISTGGETSTGTWTNATHVIAIVYKGAAAVGSHSGGNDGTGTSTTITYGSLTLNVADGSSWVAGFGGAVSATAGLTGTTTAFTANRKNFTLFNGLDTNGGVSSFANQTLAFTTASVWVSETIEIKALFYAPDEEVVVSLQRDWRAPYDHIAETD